MTTDWVITDFCNEQGLFLSVKASAFADMFVFYTQKYTNANKGF